MIKLINPHKVRVEFDAFRRYSRLSINPASYLELKDPQDVTKEGAHYYKEVASIYNLGIEVPDTKLPSRNSMDEDIYLGKSVIKDPAADQVTNRKDEVIIPETESTDESEESQTTEEVVESEETQTVEEAPVESEEEVAEESVEDEVSESSESTEVEPESLKDILKGKGLAELKDLLKKAEIEVSGRVTIASATKALLENEDKVKEVL
ncbi:hypothetical protein LIS04_62 [Listeria phage LIS04]|nr:hypothetical protein LIS04_62 [Listeria phage LIS04]